MIQIRKLQEDEVTQFVQTHIECWEETYLSFFSKSVYESRRKNKEKRISHIKRRIDHPDYHYYAVWDDFNIVGIMIFTTILKEAVLDAIYIKKNYQNKKVGVQLLQTLANDLKQQEISCYSVYVFEMNMANQFFLHLGAKKKGEDWISIHGKDYKEIEYEMAVR